MRWNNMKKYLLVEPEFPIPPKSKNHKDFLPIGLLKLGAMYKAKGHRVKLVRGNRTKKEISKIGDGRWYKPDEIMITSLFTYWKEYVVNSVDHYRNLYPSARITLGGIYASLIPDDCKSIPGIDNVWVGIHPEAETYHPAYDLLESDGSKPIDYQIIHATRGCPRKCPFCGTWRIEPEFIPKKSIKDEIVMKKIVFYDNNILMSPYVEDIFKELKELKKEKKILWCESQSGFDGRILLEKPHLAKMIKEAGFRYPRIAWDWKYSQYPSIEKQINLLLEAGYASKDITIFMLYNWDIPFEEMEKKRIKAWDWKVQISDCRYRPLTQLYDNYNPRVIGQTTKDYYIHEKAGWTDELIKQFRRNIRRQNICVRHGFPFYSKSFEQKRFGKKIMRQVKKLNRLEEKIDYMKSLGVDYWLPDKSSIYK